MVENELCRILRGYLLASFLLCSTAVEGANAIPFVLSYREAQIVDEKVDLSHCNLKKDRFSRYYWYKVIASEGGYLIDTFKVDFIVLRDGKRGVNNVIGNPISNKDNIRIVAEGHFDIDSKMIGVKCLESQ
jgi:hypothetical protein